MKAWLNLPGVCKFLNKRMRVQILLMFKMFLFSSIFSMYNKPQSQSIRQQHAGGDLDLTVAVYNSSRFYTEQSLTVRGKEINKNVIASI